MAGGASNYLFLSLLFILSLCSSATSLPLEEISLLKLEKPCPSQIRLLVADHHAFNSISNVKSSAFSGLKTRMEALIPHGDLPGENGISPLLRAMKSFHSVFSSLDLRRQLRPAVSFQLSFLEKMSQQRRRELQRVFDFAEQGKFIVIVEADSVGELSLGDRIFESVIERAAAAAAIVGCRNFYAFFKISARRIGNVDRVFVELPAQKISEVKEHLFDSSRRELLDNFPAKTTQHDAVHPPAPPATVPPPTIVTVPATNPVTITPNVPSTTPVPMNSPPPVTNPVTTPSTTPPVTNPAAAYPPPSTGVPATTPPVTNPVPPPVSTGSPAVPGQSWCVARSGAAETSLQAALDYACGIGGADCSAIQQGASCYNPNTLQNHASYAFNSYYQKKPVQTSCDFGGTAVISNTNPSTGSCIYPSSASPSSTPTPVTTPSPNITTPSPGTTTTPPPGTTTTPPAVTTPSPTITTPSPGATTTPPPASTTPSPPTSTSGGTVPGTGSPPPLVTSTDPAPGSATVIGESPPSPSMNSTASTSMGGSLEPFIAFIVLVASIVTGRFLLEI